MCSLVDLLLAETGYFQTREAACYSYSCYVCYT